MSEITKAIAAKQTQITQLQSDIETLQRAASVLGGQTTAAGQQQSRPKPKRRKKGTAAKVARQSKATSGQPKTKRKRKPWSAAARLAMSKKVKASWARRTRAAR